MDDRQQMRLDEFCRQYAVSRSYAYCQARAGKLKMHKIGWRTIIKREDAEAWRAQLPEMELANV
jgi:hypothetical protein